MLPLAILLTVFLACVSAVLNEVELEMPEVEAEIPGRRRRAVETGVAQANPIDGLNQVFQNRMKRAITVNNVPELLPLNALPATNPQPLSRKKRFLGLDGGDGLGLGLGLIGIINDQIDRVRDRVNDRIDQRRERILDMGNEIPDIGGLDIGLGIGGLGLGWGLSGGLGILGGGLLDNLLCSTIHQQNDNLNVLGIQTTEIELQQVNQIPDTAPLRRKRALPFGILGGMNIGQPFAANAGAWGGGGNIEGLNGNGGGVDGGGNVGAFGGNVGDGNAGGWGQTRGLLAGGAGVNQWRNLLQIDLNRQRELLNRMRDQMRNVLERRRDRMLDALDRLRDTRNNLIDRRRDQMERMRERIIGQWK